MEKEALQYAVENASPQFHKDDAGNEWCNRSLIPVRASQADPVDVGTLTGFCDLVTGDVESFDESNALICVNSYDQVEMVARKSDTWGRRQIFARANVPDTAGFNFGTFLDHETFSDWLAGALYGYA